MSEQLSDAHFKPGRLGYGIMLAAAMASSTATYSGLAALGPLVIADLGITRFQFGLLIAATQGTAALLAPTLGKWADRRSSRVGFFVTCAMSGASLLAVAVSPNYAWMLAAAATGGVATAMANPVTNRLLALTWRAGERGTVMGIKQTGVQVGFLFAGAALPGLAVLQGWRVALLASLLFAVLAVLMAVRRLTKNSARYSGTAVKTRTRDLVARHPVLRPVAAYALVMGAGMAAITTYLPLYAYQDLRMSAQVAGLTTAVSGGVGVVARLGWGTWTERSTRSERSLLVGVAVGATGGLGLILATAFLPASGGLTLSVFFIGVVGLAAASVGWNIVTMMLLLRDVEPRSSGAATGYVQRFFFIGLLASPALFGLLVDLTGAYWVGWSSVAAEFLIGAAMARRVPRSERSPRPSKSTAAPSAGASRAGPARADAAPPD